MKDDPGFPLARRHVLQGSLLALAAAPAQAAEAAAGLREAADLRDFGARGDGESDDAKALKAAVKQTARSKVPLHVPPGTYLIGSRVTLPRRTTIFGQDRSNTVFRMASKNAALLVAGANVALMNLSVNAQYTADYCLLTPDDPWTAGLRAHNCVFRGAERANVHLGRNADDFRFSHCWIRSAGKRERKKKGAKPITLGAHCVVNRTEGQFVGTVIASATGSLVRQEGRYLLFLGGRLNHAYEHLVHVIGHDLKKSASVLLYGTFLENPNVLAEGRAVNPKGLAAVLADGPHARVSIVGAEKLHVQKAHAGIQAINGAQVHYEGPIRTIANRRAKRSYLFSTAGGAKPGKITFSRVDLRHPERDWAGLAICPSSPDGLTVIPDQYAKVARLVDGGDAGSLRPVNAALSLDRSDALTGTAALRVTANGRRGPHGAVLEFVPRGFRDELLMIVAVMRTRGAGPGRQRMAVAGKGLILNGPDSCVVDADPTGAAQGAWKWLQLFFTVTDDSLPVELTLFHNDGRSADGGASLVDFVDLYAVESRRPGLAL